MADSNFTYSPIAANEVDCSKDEAIARAIYEREQHQQQQQQQQQEQQQQQPYAQRPPPYYYGSFVCSL